MTSQSADAPTSTAGYAWRPLRKDDLPALHALTLAVSTADHHDRAETLAELETEFSDPWSDPEADARLVVAADGALAAHGRCFMPPEFKDEAYVWLRFEVHPDHRGRGLDDAVLDWLEARAAERLRVAPSGLPRTVRTTVPDTVTHELELLERRDYRPIRYFNRMRRDLRQPIPEAPVPAGLTLRHYAPEIDQALYRAHIEAFADHWSYAPETLEEWHSFVIGHAAFRPDLTLIALDGDQVAAYTVNWVMTDGLGSDAKPFGYLEKVGTRRPWRKRGLASALMAETMRLFRAEGLAEAYLAVDAANPTGALAVYERLGFTVARRFIAYEKPAAG